MYHYRQALVRMRQGESDRQIQATGLMGRRTLGALRRQAQAHGWLDPARALPSDQELASVLQRQKPAPAGQHSSLEPYRALIETWCTDGIDGTTIHAALKRRHGYTGSYSSVRSVAPHSGFLLFGRASHLGLRDPLPMTKVDIRPTRAQCR
jgi:hypothetical protein